jgi:hypothetical protein
MILNGNKQQINKTLQSDNYDKYDKPALVDQDRNVILITYKVDQNRNVVLITRKRILSYRLFP